MAEKDYSLPFMSAEVAEDKTTVDILTGSPLNTKNPTTKRGEEDYHIYQYPNTIQDRLTDRDYKNTNSDIAAIEQGLEQVEDYPILNDIEFQADLEKIISGNVLTQVGLRALMEKTEGNLSKVLQNYTNNKELGLDEIMGEVGSTGSPPDKTKEAPYDYNTRYVDDESNPLYLLNPKIRINLSDLADQDSALQTQWRKTKKDLTPDNLNSLRGLLNVSSYGNKNTPLSQANAISHELMHFAIIELYNKGLLDKATIEKLREDNSLSVTGDNEIEELFISKITKEKDLEKDPAYKGMYPSEEIFGDLKSKFNDTKLQNRIESAAETWLKTYSPPAREYDSSNVPKAEEPKFKEEMYDGAIPAGLAKGGDIMPMEQQMQMFAIGGLDDDGMSRDPISGNEIPPGSMANEVRDDVDAKLSDGEYVVPANVVRFFGVKFFEDLRTQAMQGLDTMEANGRIGGEPVPSDMPMQDQMAEIMPDVSEEEMQMLQGLMNEGGYVRGYAPGGAVVPKDVDLENPPNYPFNPSPFLTVGGSYLSPNNPNVTPDPNLPPTTMPVTPNPESGISFVTMVNPATGAIQVVQFMGGDPVDGAAYNKLISNGFYVQDSPELAAYKEKLRQDNREEPDTTTRPHPSEATISELGQLIAESSKGGGSLFEMIPGITGAVKGKLAKDYRNDITKALDTFIGESKNVANKKAAEAMKAIWTNADLTSKERKAAISKAGLYTGASVKNAMGKKAGKFGSENWYGLTPQEEINKLFGSYSDPTFKIDADTRTIDGEEKTTTDAERISDRLATGKGTESDKAAEAKRLKDYNRIMNENNNDNDNDNNQGSGSGPISSTSEKAIDLAAAGSGNYGGAGGRAKGGLIKKRKKKK